MHELHERVETGLKTLREVTELFKQNYWSVSLLKKFCPIPMKFFVPSRCLGHANIVSLDNGLKLRYFLILIGHCLSMLADAPLDGLNGVLDIREG